MNSSLDVGRNRAAADIAIQVIGRLLNLLPGIVVALLLTRTLGDDGFGEWSTALAIVQIGAYVGDFGLEQVTVRHAAADREREHEWIGALLTLRLALAVPVTIGCAIAQVLIATSPEMLAAGLLLSGTMLLSALSAVQSSFQLRVRNDLGILVMTVNSVLWAGAVIALATSGSGVVAFAAAFLVSSAISTGVGLWLAARINRLQIRNTRRLWRDLARIGVPVGIAGLLVTAYVKLDQILLFTLAGPHDAGLYGAIYRILDQAQLIPTAIMTTLFPLIAASWPQDMARVRRLTQLITDHLALLSLPALAFTIVASEPLVLLLFGDEFREAAGGLPILMGAFVAICFGYLAGHLVIVLELQRVFLRNAAIALVFNVALNLLLIPPYGFVAAAWVTLATEVLVTALTLRAALRRLDLSLDPRRIARAVVAAAVMAIAVAATQSQGVGIGVLLAVAAVVYPVAALAFGAVTVADVRQVVQLRNHGAD